MITNFEALTNKINSTSGIFLNKVRKQVNSAYTMRNWLIGHYIVEYEQHGEDRAVYGDKLLERLAGSLKKNGLVGMSGTNLKLFRQLYILYPQIGQTLSGEFKQVDFQIVADGLATVKYAHERNSCSPEELLAKLSFSHFIELFKADADVKRIFYETEAIKNNWSVRELQRAMNSLLYERTGLSKVELPIVEKKEPVPLIPENFFRDPYMLEFLELEEKPSYTESDLESSIIDHLQSFLLELGKGFCFETRQKRITFDNTHYRIDLVFYHRILKCHVLVDLKIGEFSHADAGQMNVYLNYYRENEMSTGDNPPIGIILCAGKNETLVKYATAGLAHKLFVSKYMINLPSEDELVQILEEESEKVQN
ncbi:PDDEXK nuclease domain-containing protein [Chitinophaga niabensis]|uniref:Predicted nuclease of restriction endonuclease-like (RecB) superfamily, DUF1016 family n=1 Tax=Chitinophaga niabensis TaxID=536979 RepID=A0A1N6F8Q6_9BACT|nr:PDDEXK nuclease domain-containing protein [Chitinophaga niabensis]SIN91661.1 Predicted nuclease of restriction endonuclease-like (RecB) superfamily, DUF1016 family [Chitinophaga niabensis]